MAYSDFVSHGLPLYETFEEAKNDPNFLSSIDLDVSKDLKVQVVFIYSGTSRMVHDYPLIHTWINGNLVFYGNNLMGYSIYAGVYIDSLDAMVMWLDGMCIQDGNVEDEFFEKYTADQLAWRDSRYAEDLLMLCNDYTNDDIEDECEIEEQKYAMEFFSEGFRN
jgi:hypothetical protein